jgi:hypothetical protein
MLVQSIHGPKNLTTVQTAKLNMVHLFGDNHWIPLDCDRDDYLLNVIKKIPSERNIKVIHEAGFFNPTCEFRLLENEFSTFPNVEFICSDARSEAQGHGVIPGKISRAGKHFSNTNYKKPRNVKNYPKALEFVNSLKKVFDISMSFRELVQHCTELSNILLSLSNHQNTISIDDILMFANNVYDNFRTASSSLLSWFCEELHIVFKIMDSDAMRMKRKFSEHRKGFVYCSGFGSWTTSLMALFCDLVTLNNFSKTEESDTTYMLLYGMNHTSRIWKYFTKYEHFKTLQSIAAVRVQRCPVTPTVEFRKRRATRVRCYCKPRSALRDRPDFILL